VDVYFYGEGKGVYKEGMEELVGICRSPTLVQSMILLMKSGNGKVQEPHADF
jgi:hypothetical protein